MAVSIRRIGGEAWIRDQAGSETNVEVDPQTGLVRPTRTTIPTLPVMLLDYGTVCTRIAPPVTAIPHFVYGFEVVHSNTSCSWARTLIFAYERHEGPALREDRSGAPVRSLAGWRCRGLVPTRSARPRGAALQVSVRPRPGGP